jgi:hypothetical protein
MPAQDFAHSPCTLRPGIADGQRNGVTFGSKLRGDEYSERDGEYASHRCPAAVPP